MNDEILNIEEYIKNLSEIYIQKNEDLKNKLKDNIDNLITTKSSTEILSLIKESKNLNADEKQTLIDKYKENQLTFYEWTLISRESLINENLSDQEILNKTGLDEIIDYAQTGAIKMATEKLQDFSVKLVKKIATEDNNSSIKINGQEMTVEIPEELYTSVIGEFKDSLTQITTDSIKDLTNQLLEVYSAEENLLNNKNIIAQGPYNRPNYLIKFTGKTSTLPFRLEYSPEMLSESLELGVRVNPKKGDQYLNIIKMNAIGKDLDELDLEIIEAYYTEKKANPDIGGISFLDIANDIYRSKSGRKLRTRDKFVKEIQNRCWRLTDLPFYIDFNPQIDYILQYYHDGEVKDNFKKYREDGGTGRIRTHFIQANSVLIRKTNGTIQEGLTFGSQPADDVFFNYIEMTREFKSIPNALLLNPLSATEENVILHNYLALRVCQLPYGFSQDKLVKTKLNLLDKTKVDSKAKKTEEYKKALKYQKSLPKEKLTIRLDTLKKDLKLNTRSTRLTEKILRFLDDWKEEKFINNYDINYTKNNRSVESFTLYFF